MKDAGPETSRMAVGRSAIVAPPQITFVVNGFVDAASRVVAEDEFRRLMRAAPRPVVSARVKLTVDELRLKPQQALAQGTLIMEGAVVRGEAAGATATQAVDRLADRLEGRLCRAIDRSDSRPQPEWMSGGRSRNRPVPDTRPDFFPRPPDERQVVRRKTPAPLAISIEEAVFTMEMLDYRFFLFSDQSDGVDSIVFADGPDVRCQRSTGAGRSMGLTGGVELIRAHAPQLALDAAASRVAASDRPFIFYRQVGSSRAAVLYRRYDGHYGLLALPVAATEDRLPSL